MKTKFTIVFGKKKTHFKTIVIILRVVSTFLQNNYLKLLHKILRIILSLYVLLVKYFYDY